MVKIRLARRGRKFRAIYDIVVADARAPRDGKFIEKLGSYNPNSDPATVVLNTKSAMEWLFNGAQPTDTVRNILSHEGVMMMKHLQVGVNKGAITQETADARFADWKAGKTAKIADKADGASKKAANAKQAAFDAEKKVNEARAEAIALKNKVVEVVPVVEAPAVVEEVVAVVEAPAVVEEVVAVVETPAVVEEAVAPVETPAVVEEVAAVVEAPAVVEEAAAVVETPTAVEEVVAETEATAAEEKPAA